MSLLENGWYFCSALHGGAATWWHFFRANAACLWTWITENPEVLKPCKKIKKTFQTTLMERINKFWQSITLTHHLKGLVTVLGVHVSWRLHISAFDENYLVEWYSILDLLLWHGIMSLKVDSKKWENKLRIQGLISSSFSIEINLAGLSIHPNLNHLGFLRGFQLFAVYQPQLQDHVFCGRRIPIIF